ncbi:MAG: glycoside hydrolase N-terminal domain-containing protein [Paludibaculum sp.]
MPPSPPPPPSEAKRHPRNRPSPSGIASRLPPGWKPCPSATAAWAPWSSAASKRNSSSSTRRPSGPATPATATTPIARRNLPDVRRLLFEGKEQEATELAGNTMMGVPKTIQLPDPRRPLIELPGATQAAEDRRTLDLDQAIAATFLVNGARVTRESSPPPPTRS